MLLNLSTNSVAGPHLDVGLNNSAMLCTKTK